MEKILRDPQGLGNQSTVDIVGLQRTVVIGGIWRNPLIYRNTDNSQRSSSPVVVSKSETKVEKILRDPEGTGPLKEEKKGSKYQYKPKPRLTSPVLETADEEKENAELLVCGSNRRKKTSVIQDNVSLLANGELAERIENRNQITSSPKTVALPVPLKNEKEIFAYPIVDIPVVGSYLAGKIIDVFPMSKDCQLTIFDNSKTQLVNEIEKEMGQLYNSESTSYYLIESELRCGCYGVFIPEWDKWVRCYLTLFRPGKEEFIVKLMDYATTKRVSRKDLRLLTKRFYALPEQSYRAKLHITSPDVLLLLQSHGKEKIIFFRVMGAQTHGPSGFVILSLMMTCQSKNELMEKVKSAVVELEDIE